MEPIKMKESDTLAFAEYLQNSVSLDALERMTSALDQDLVDSQRVMTDMKTMFDSVCNSRSASSEANPEDLARFLEADTPNLLMPGMERASVDSDLKDVISSVKKYAEELQKNVSIVQPEVNTASKSGNGHTRQELSSLNLDQYVMNLDNLKRLNAKLTERAHSGLRSPELEDKLTQLCHDINMVAKAIEAKAAISEWNKNSKEILPDNDKALSYSDQLSKLLANINEVMYLLQKKG